MAVEHRHYIPALEAQLVSSGGQVHPGKHEISEDVGGEVTSTALLLNGYYDVQIGQPLEPYIGLGLGLAEINVDSADLATNDSDIVIAYQIAAGFKYRITDQLSAKAGYKFLATADPTINGTEAEYMTHNVEFGLVYDF